jgi:hypothetical protein
MSVPLRTEDAERSGQQDRPPSRRRLSSVARDRRSSSVSDGNFATAAQMAEVQQQLTATRTTMTERLGGVELKLEQLMMSVSQVALAVSSASRPLEQGGMGGGRGSMGSMGGGGGGSASAMMAINMQREQLAGGGVGNLLVRGVGSPGGGGGGGDQADALNTPGGRGRNIVIVCDPGPDPDDAKVVLVAGLLPAHSLYYKMVS